MNLLSVLRESGFENAALADSPVTNVTQVIEKVEKGSIFVAVKGKNIDGNEYIGEALTKGAVAVFSDETEKPPFVIKVKNARETLGKLSSAFFSHPERKMKIIGITGTNGKTTVAHYIKHLIEKNSEKCGIIGTLGSFCDGYGSQTGYTTPTCEELFYELYKISESGARYCVMEVSSQALFQKRTYPIRFALGILTNIGRDHLDYHGSLESYIAAKKMLFGMCEKALINADDYYSDEFSAICSETFTFSVKDPLADFCAKNISVRGEDISYIFLSKYGFSRLRLKGIGEIPIYNSLTAVSALCVLGFSQESLSDAVGSFPSVKGRMQKFSNGNIDVFIDFAHTPEALSAVLSSLYKIKKGRLICVFGCGGDRDPGKRSEMGMISSRFCDIIVITSDNPRNEDPEAIADDIYKGIKNKKNIYRKPDREEAIAFAVGEASSGDIVLIAGKGHEEYQLVGGEKVYFSDEEILKKYLF